MVGIEGESIYGVPALFQAEDGIRDLVRSRGLGDVYKRQLLYRAEAGDVLAEASAYSDAYHCDGTAACLAQVQSLSLIHI